MIEYCNSGMDRQCILEGKCMMADDLLLDSLHFVHMFQDKDHCIYYEYMHDLRDSLNSRHIRADNLRMDFQCIPVSIDMLRHRFVHDKQHLIHMD